MAACRSVARPRPQALPSHLHSVPFSKRALPIVPCPRNSGRLVMTAPDSPAAEVNGTTTKPSSSSPPPSSPPFLPSTHLPLPEVCAQIHKRVHDFLAEDPVTERVRSVQEQTRTSLSVISEALGRYKYGSRRCIQQSAANTRTRHAASMSSPSPTTAAKTASSFSSCTSAPCTHTHPYPPRPCKPSTSSPHTPSAKSRTSSPPRAPRSACPFGGSRSR